MSLYSFWDTLGTSSRKDIQALIRMAAFRGEESLRRGMD